MLGVDEDDLVRRAMAAYFRLGTHSPIPGAGVSCVEILNDKAYVVLANGQGEYDDILACYRVRNDGKLKRLRRIPRDLRP